MVPTVLLSGHLHPDDRASTDQKIATSAVAKMTRWQNPMVEASSLIRSALAFTAERCCIRDITCITFLFQGLLAGSPPRRGGGGAPKAFLLHA